MDPESVVDYTTMSTDELAAAERAAVEKFNGLYEGNGNHNAESVAALSAAAEAVNTARAELASRAEAASAAESLREMVNAETSAPEVVTEPEPELVTASAPERGRVDVRDVLKSGNRLNASLAEASRHTPAVPAADAPRRDEMVLVASADIPGFTQGSHLGDIYDLVTAMQRRSRMLPDHSGYVPVASLQRQFSHKLSIDSTAETISQVLREVADPSVLTAAGGWCAPSEISYDFYNIVCEDGLIDLPTTGISRGGMRWPVSASFGDLAGQVWTWTETQDIAAATGTGQSGTKPCFRVPCPDFDEERLACDGICLTVGNLTQDAFPELIANHTRLLMAARAHYTNARIIQQLVTGSTSVIFTPTGHGWAAPILEAVELQVLDYRIKFRMCDNVLLEAIFPTWVLGGFRADLAKRNGVDMMSVTDAQIADWFTQRGVRVQFVQDWQVGTTGLLGQDTPSTTWPLSVQFLLYAAGTWMRGNGLQLDLGVIRDSTLNATNDFTAAWMEDCYLIAQIGHESRVVTVPLCANGATGAQVTMGCTL